MKKERRKARQYELDISLGNTRQSQESKLVRYYVETTGGNVVYNGNDQVTVQVNPTSYLRKKVSDLNTGELVVYDVRHVKTSLEDVEPYFNRSPLYARAETFVFENNSRGIPIPKLRIALMRALGNRGFFQTSNLEDRIMDELTPDGRVVKDFALEEYEAAANYVKNVLENNLRPQEYAYISAEGSIKAWLTGKTLAPRDHKVFGLLKREFGSSFDSFLSHPEDNSGFYKNYRIRTVLRQQVGKMLNSWKGECNLEEREKYEKRKITDVKREVDSIRSGLLKDVTDDLKLVRVTDIERRVEGQEPQRRTRFLGEGVVRGMINELRGSMVNYSEVFEDMDVLKGFFKELMMKSVDTPLSFSNVYDLGDFVLPNFLDIFGEMLDPEMEYLRDKKEAYISYLSSRTFDTTWKQETKEDFKNRSYDMIKKFIEKATEMTLNCEIDSKYGYQEGTTFNLLTSFFRTRRVLPRILLEHLKRHQEMLFSIRDHDLSKRKDLEKRILLVNEEMFRRYEIKFNKYGIRVNGGEFLTDFIGNLIAGSPQNYVEDILVANERGVKPATAYIEAVKDKGIFPYLIKGFKREGIKLRSREDVLSILKKYALEQIVDLRKEDFVADDIYMDLVRQGKALAPGSGL